MRKIFLVFLMVVCVTPLFVRGQVGNPDGSRAYYLQQSGSQDGGTGSGNPADVRTGNKTNDASGNKFQIVPCEGVDNPATGKKEVECDFNMLIVGINRIVKFLLYLSIPLVAGMILYMGFKYLTANGDAGKLADAKKMFVPVALGIFWVFAAYIVVYTILDKLVADSLGGVPKEDIIFLDINK